MKRAVRITGTVIAGSLAATMLHRVILALRIMHPARSRQPTEQEMDAFAAQFLKTAEVFVPLLERATDEREASRLTEQLIYALREHLPPRVSLYAMGKALEAKEEENHVPSNA